MRNQTILLLGASGYVGAAFKAELMRRGLPFSSLSRKDLDYTSFDRLWNHLKQSRPALVINAAGYRGKPNVDACETAQVETLLGNTLFPQTVAHACVATSVPFGHVSSGCIYSGAKIAEHGKVRIEPNLMKPELAALIGEELKIGPRGQSQRVLGFAESDPPNFTFRAPPCSFYSGTKALAEEALAPLANGYLWRLRMPFDQFDDPRNYLAKIQNYARVYDNVNSLSHLGDFVRACLDLWQLGAPFGIYNVVNPGWVRTRYVGEMIEHVLKRSRAFEFWASDEEFYKAAKAPRSNCVIDASKLLAAGVHMRNVEEALLDSLQNWAGRGNRRINS